MDLLTFEIKMIFTEFEGWSEYNLFIQKSINPHIYRIKTVIVLFHILNKKNVFNASDLIFTGSKCLDLINTYKCHCSDGFTGTNCEKGMNKK